MSRGRAFRAEEARAAARVAVVSESTARAFWPGADPIGQTIRIERRRADRDRRDRRLHAGHRHRHGRRRRQRPDGRGARRRAHLPADGRVGSARDRAADHAARGGRLPSRHAARDLPPRRAAIRHVFEVIPLDEMRQTQIYPMRAAAWVGALLGGIALVLSVSGLYGVLSYTLAQRTPRDRHPHGARRDRGGGRRAS